MGYKSLRPVSQNVNVKIHVEMLKTSVFYFFNKPACTVISTYIYFNILSFPVIAIAIMKHISLLHTL